MRLAFALLLLPAATAALSGQQYYRSDPLGLRGPAVTSRRDDVEWLLMVEQSGALRTETLLKDGVEQQVVSIRTSATGREELLRVDGVVRRIERYNERGQLTEEERYTDGELLVRYEYDYTDGQLTARSAFSPDGRVERERYRYWRDGSLRMVERVGSDERVVYRYRDGGVTSEERLFDGFREAWTFDQFGRSVERTLYADGSVVEREERTYRGDPPAGLLTVTVSSGADTRVERYNEDGVVVAVDERADGSLTGEVERILEDGLVVEERELRGGVRYRTVYDYTDGELSEQRRFRGDELIQRIVYRNDGRPDNLPDRVETIYRDGLPVLEVDYDGERRIEERVIRDGEVIRVRRFGKETGS